MIVDKFSWKVGFLGFLKGVVSSSVWLVNAPLDVSFDALWEVVYGSSGNLY